MQNLLWFADKCIAKSFAIRFGNLFVDWNVIWISQHTERGELLCNHAIYFHTSTVLKFSLFPLPVFCAVNCFCILSATETIHLSFNDIMAISVFFQLFQLSKALSFYCFFFYNVKKIWRLPSAPFLTLQLLQAS